MLVDDGRVHVRDLGSLGETVAHERVQRIGVRNREVEEEVLLARDHEHADELRLLR